MGAKDGWSRKSGSVRRLTAWQLEYFGLQRTRQLSSLHMYMVQGRGVIEEIKTHNLKSNIAECES